MLPSLFIAHGSPMLALEENAYTQFLNGLGSTMKPNAILVFSAHWESDVQMVSSLDQYSTIHDFGGFPAELYQMTYPAKGEAQTAAQIGRLFEAEGIPHLVEQRRGLDHGAWVVLRLLYPNADVPVVAMSVDPTLPPAAMYRIGKALARLRAEDVLIIGSGGTIHNFATIKWDSQEVDPWAIEFDNWLTEKLTAWDLDALFDYERLAPHARLAVPPHGKEHFIPLIYAMGAADDQRTTKELFRGYQYGNLSHGIWQFGG